VVADAQLVMVPSLHHLHVVTSVQRLAHLGVLHAEAVELPSQALVLVVEHSRVILHLVQLRQMVFIVCVIGL